MVQDGKFYVLFEHEGVYCNCAGPFNDADSGLRELDKYGNSARLVTYQNGRSETIYPAPRVRFKTLTSNRVLIPE